MLRSGEDILNDIDTTLDQLITNASMILQLSMHPLYNEELAYLQKTQESLLAHLIHMDQLLDTEEKKKKEKPVDSKEVKQKLIKLARLNTRVVRYISQKIDQRKKTKQRLKRR